MFNYLIISYLDRSSGRAFCMFLDISDGFKIITSQLIVASCRENHSSMAVIYGLIDTHF